MARKKSVDDTVPQGKGDVLFINYDLDDATKANFKKWVAASGEKLEDMINHVLETGYQISLKKDTYNNCMGSFLIAKGTNTDNDGFILTGRGSTAVSALYGVFFRHFVLFEQQWPVHNRRANLLDDD